MLAEPIIDTSTRSAAREFVSDGIVRAEDWPRLERINVQIKRLRTSLASRIGGYRMIRKIAANHLVEPPSL